MSLGWVTAYGSLRRSGGLTRFSLSGLATVRHGGSPNPAPFTIPDRLFAGNHQMIKHPRAHLYSQATPDGVANSISRCSSITKSN
jgi:hypothetical protein